MVTQSKPSAKAYEVATKIACEVYGPYLACANEENKELAIAPLAVLIDAALARLIKEAHKHAIEAGPSCVLARELAPWEPESGGGR